MVEYVSTVSTSKMLLNEFTTMHIVGEMRTAQAISNAFKYYLKLLAETADQPGNQHGLAQFQP